MDASEAHNRERAEARRQVLGRNGETNGLSVFQAFNAGFDAARGIRVQIGDLVYEDGDLLGQVIDVQPDGQSYRAIIAPAHQLALQPYEVVE